MMDLFTPLGCNFRLPEWISFKAAMRSLLCYTSPVALLTFSCAETDYTDTDLPCWAEPLADMPFVRVVYNEWGLCEALFVKNRKSGQWLYCPVICNRQVNR